LNALDRLLIPHLETERGLIQMALDELERSDHFQLKLTKRILKTGEKSRAEYPQCFRQITQLS
jgi:vacuolar-type H+-ATPase subunit D/Vma8